jgi:hypothetical protein
VGYSLFSKRGGIRSLPASSRQPSPEFAFAFNGIEVPPDQLLGVVRAGYIHFLPRAVLGRIRPPKPRREPSSR